MKSLKDISKTQTLALQAEKKQALNEVKKSLAQPASFARNELPNIEAAFAQADLWRRQNLDPVDWKAIGGMPRSIANALFEIERQRNNVGVLQDMIRRYDALTWRDAWGHRTDGTRDVNQAATLRGSFNFLLARGCVHSIEKNVNQLKAEIARIEERVAWNNGQTVSPEVRLIAVPPAHSDELKVLDNYNHQD